MSNKHLQIKAEVERKTARNLMIEKPFRKSPVFTVLLNASQRLTAVHTGQISTFACPPHLCDENSERANKRRAHCRSHPRQIRGRVPPRIGSSHAEGLRSASCNSARPFRPLDCGRSEAKGLRRIHSKRWEGAREDSESSAVGCSFCGFHASCFLLVHLGTERLARREEAEVKTTRSVDRRLGVRWRQSDSAIARKANDAIGSEDWSAPGRSAELEVVGYKRNGDPHLPVEDRKAARNWRRQRTRTDIGPMLEAAQRWLRPWRVRHYSQMRWALYQLRFSGALAKNNQEVGEVWKQTVFVPRYSCPMRYEMRQCRNRNEIAWPQQHKYDFARVSQRDRESSMPAWSRVG